MPPAASSPATSRTAPGSAERIAQQRTVMLQAGAGGTPPPPRRHEIDEQGLSRRLQAPRARWPALAAGARARCWLAALRQAAPAPRAGRQRRADIVTPSDEPEARRRARIRLELASGYFEQGQTNDRARRDQAGRSPIDPTFAEAYNLRGLIYMRLNDMRPGRRSFRRAVALNPRDANAHAQLRLAAVPAGPLRRSARARSTQALANPLYAGPRQDADGAGPVPGARRPACRGRAQPARAPTSSMPANPVTGYNLASLLYQRGDCQRAQFYIRRLNNSDLGQRRNAVAGHQGRAAAERPRWPCAQLGDQLRRRFPQSREARRLRAGSFR